MNSDDHLGDTFRRAREGRRVAVDEAACAAGVEAKDYSELELSGRMPPSLNLKALAIHLGLSPDRIERMAKGWLPAVPDLTLWRELRQITTRGPEYSVHCYLAWDEATRDAALFDTGFEAAPIFQLVEENHLTLRHLFITHTHEDHIGALGTIRERFPKVRLHSGSKHAPVDQRNRANDFIHVGSLRITNRATPGHSEDGVTYIVGSFPEDAPSVAIVGDAIFAGSIGGAAEQYEIAMEKIREQILSLPADTLICPGHGSLTTVAEEKTNNPFFG